MGDAARNLDQAAQATTIRCMINTAGQKLTI